MGSYSCITPITTNTTIITTVESGVVNVNIKHKNPELPEKLCYEEEEQEQQETTSKEKFDTTKKSVRDIINKQNSK